MSDITAPLRERIGWLLLKSHRNVKRMADKRLAAIGVSTAHIAILELLRATPGLSQATIGTALEIDRTSIGVTIAELEAAGIVRRVVDATDRRGYAIRLTAAGRALAEKASERAVAAQEQFLAPLDARERRELVRLLQRLVGDSG